MEEPSASVAITGAFSYTGKYTTRLLLDNNGNTKTKSDGTQYTWDYENRLTQVVLPGSAGTVNFKYDSFGRRVQKSLTQGSTTTITNYLYDGPNLLEEVDQSGNVLARYSQGGIDEPLSELRGAITSYYQQDALRSVTSLSNGAGALANFYTYDSYGTQTASSGTLTNPFRYTGREFDQETGIYFYRARYYDATAGRFANEDPMSFAAGVNFYAYVGNAPINLTDSRGLAPDWWNNVLDRLYPPVAPPRPRDWPTPPAPFIPFRCNAGVNCDFTPDMSAALDRFRICLGRQITVTSGRGPRKKPNSSHERGEGCDLGRNNNPNISHDDAASCWMQADPHGYGQEENNEGPGTHYHVQYDTVPNGVPRFPDGVQPYTP